MSTITTVFNTFTDVQAYNELESKRQATGLDPSYQQWMKELNVSRSYVQPEGTIRAKLLNDQYDFSTSSPKSPILNFLKLKGIWS